MKSSLVWLTVALLCTAQIALFLLSYIFVPHLAFLINVVALPLEYYLFDKRLEKFGIQRKFKGHLFPKDMV